MLNYDRHEAAEDSQSARSRQADSPQDQGNEWSAGAHSSHASRSKEHEATFLAAEGETPAAMPEVYEGEAEPWWPTMEDAVGTNQQAYADYEQGPWGGIIGGKEGMIDSALNAAKQHYYYGPEEDEAERLVVAAAKMANRLHSNQAFVDGNKRTAYVTTRRFLDLNGLGHLSPIPSPDEEPQGGGEDQELADYLIAQDWKSDPTHGHLYKSEDDFINMMRDRYYQGGPRTDYQPVNWPPRGGQPGGGSFVDYGEGRQANILDAVHDGLDPSVWDDPLSAEPTLRAEHSAFLFEHIYTTLQKHGYDGMDKWLSLVFTGSLTTYQYSEDSDVDISLWVDAAVFPEWSRAEMIGIMVHEIDGTNLPGTTHPIQNFVVASTRFTKEDLYKPGLRSGYDMNTDTWIVPPDRSRVHDVEKEMNEAYTIALENADKMEKLLRYEPDKAVMFWHQVHKRRQRDQMAGKGDYSPSNITYKMLNNRGLFPQIEEASGEHIAKVAQFEDQLPQIAQAYQAAPEHDPLAEAAWRELAADSAQRANAFRQQYNISETDDPEPYPTAQHMFDDIGRGNFVVSRANSEHPVWTPEENVNFRIVHDLGGHLPTQADFSWPGENKACGAHFPLLSPAAQKALFTECIGQAAYANQYGGFGPQKVSLLNPQAVDLGRHGTGGTLCHRHIRSMGRTHT